MKLFVLLTSWVKFSTSVEVVDCTLPACPTDNCNVNTVECDRTCDGGVFGADAVTECPSDQLKMTGSCGDAACEAVMAATDSINVNCKPETPGIIVTISTSVFENMEIDPMSTDLAGDIALPCYKKLITFSSWSWMEYYVPLDAVCGTTIVSTVADITFSNKVLGEPTPDGSIVRGYMFDLDFECTFGSHEVVGIGGIMAKMETKTFNVEQDGVTFDLVMALFDSDEFKDLQPNPFNITVPDLLFGQVEIIGTPETFVLRLKECWATKTDDPTSDPKYKFIEDFIAVPETGTTIIIDVTPSVERFTLKSFVWDVDSISEPDEIYLNCEVFICEVTDDEDCARPVAPAGRRRRSVDTAEENLTTIQIGPIGI